MNYSGAILAPEQNTDWFYVGQTPSVDYKHITGKWLWELKMNM
jgi:hypothetical protein